MIQITPQMRIVVAVAPVDFRRGIDGIARLCKESLSSDPFAGTVYVFRNKRRTAIKILVYDGQGFWLCHKRLSQGRFEYWPDNARASAHLAAPELHVLLFGGDHEAAKTAPDWRRVTM